MNDHVYDLSSISGVMRPLLDQGLQHFLPEMILAVGFLLSLVLDLFLRKGSTKVWSAAFALAVLVASMIATVAQLLPASAANHWQGGIPIFRYSLQLPSSYAMLVVDNFSVLLKILVALAVILTLLMSLGSGEIMPRVKRLGEYHALLLAMTLGMFLLAAATDLFMIFLALECTAIPGFLLVGFLKEEKRNNEGAIKYLLWSLFSSAVMLYGISLFYGATGSTNLIAIRHVLIAQQAHALVSTPILWIATALVLIGLGTRISMVPLHFWSPDIYEAAPIPVVGLLSIAPLAAAMGAMTHFLLFAFPPSLATAAVSVIDWPLLIAVLSVVTMTFGNIAALQQSNLKRLFAYSTITHSGYILTGLVAAGADTAKLGVMTGASDSGVVSMLIYLTVFLFISMGAFYTLMLLRNTVGSEEIIDYRGLYHRTPLLCAALAVFLIALSGLPLTGGFIGRLYLFTAILSQPRWIWLALAMAINTVLSLYCYLRVVTAIFLKEPDEAILLEQSNGMLKNIFTPLSYPVASKVLLFVFLVPVIVLGVYFQPVVNLAQQAIRFFDALNPGA